MGAAYLLEFTDINIILYLRAIVKNYKKMMVKLFIISAAFVVEKCRVTG